MPSVLFLKFQAAGCFFSCWWHSKCLLLPSTHILDLLLAEIPGNLQAELRLGLQEALVNAAKHGNNLDPGKKVVVRFSLIDDRYWWIISDQGEGFAPKSDCEEDPAEYLPPDESENGRGLSILHFIFDRVEWNRKGTELRLCKQLEHKRRIPLLRN